MERWATSHIREIYTVLPNLQKGCDLHWLLAAGLVYSLQVGSAKWDAAESLI